MIYSDQRCHSIDATGYYGKKVFHHFLIIFPLFILSDFIGIPGLFRGLSSTMAREMPGYFFFFGGYELAKDFLRSKPEEENIGIFQTFLN